MLSQAIDDDCNQTGQMTAALLDWPQVRSNLDAVFSEQGQANIAKNIQTVTSWLLQVLFFLLVFPRFKCDTAVLVSGYAPVLTVLSKLAETSFSQY